MKNRSCLLHAARTAATCRRSNHRQNRLSLAAFIFAASCISGAAQASLISLNSIYGADSITLDTDTGLEWLDVSTALTYQIQYPLRSYNQVLGELGAGGLFEGFRYAVRSEVETLLYSSFGFDPVTSSSSSTVTLEDKMAASSLMTMLDYTLGWDYGGGSFAKVLDAVFDDENPDSPVGAMYVFSGMDHSHNPTGGLVTFYSQTYTNSNSTPYGHFLVRQSATHVDEPPALSLAGMALAGLFLAWRRRQQDA